MDRMVVIQSDSILDTTMVVMADIMDITVIMETMEDTMVLEQISLGKDKVDMEVMVGLEVMAVFHLIMDIIQMIIMVIVTLVTATTKIQI